MDVSMQIKKTALRTALGYIEKNPEENVLKLMDWVDKLAGDGPNSFPAQRKAFRNVLNDPECSMYQLIMSVFRDIDRAVCLSAERTVRYLRDGGKSIDPMTVSTYEFYKR